jgi:hypothetical protein
MRLWRPLPVRPILPLSVATVCTYLAFSNHFASISRGPVDSFGWGAPPPPPEAFLEVILVFPGIPAGLPLIIAAVASGSTRVVHIGSILGATFFWYGVGWYVDLGRGLLEADRPPAGLACYMSALRIISVILFPLGVLSGLSVGNHLCAIGAPPIWSETLMYGITMTWISLGTVLAYLRYRLSRRRDFGSLFSSQP